MLRRKERTGWSGFWQTGNALDFKQSRFDEVINGLDDYRIYQLKGRALESKMAH